MKMQWSIVLSALFLGVSVKAQVIIPKIDTTVKVGKVGYRVACKNKNYDENQLEVRPVGFSNEAREVNFMLRGRVVKAEIDDLNSDGYPDLVLYVYTVSW